MKNSHRIDELYFTFIKLFNYLSANKKLFADRVSANKKIFADTRGKQKYIMRFEIRYFFLEV